MKASLRRGLVMRAMVLSLPVEVFADRAHQEDGDDIGEDDGDDAAGEAPPTS